MNPWQKHLQKKGKKKKSTASQVQALPSSRAARFNTRTQTICEQLTSKSLVKHNTFRCLGLI